MTCPEVTLNCLVLIWSTTDNPDQVHVDHMNSGNGTDVVFLGATDVSVACSLHLE